MTDKMAS